MVVVYLAAEVKSYDINLAINRASVCTWWLDWRHCSSSWRLNIPDGSFERMFQLQVAALSFTGWETGRDEL